MLQPYAVERRYLPAPPDRALLCLQDPDPGHIQLHHPPSEAETFISPPAPVSESCQTRPELLFERIRGCGSPAADTGSAECSDIGPAAQSGVWVHPQLQGLLLTLRQSASTMAHDMRNPLTLVLAMSDLLRKKDDVAAEVRQQCSVVHVRPHINTLIQCMTV